MNQALTRFRDRSKLTGGPLVPYGQDQVEEEN